MKRFMLVWCSLAVFMMFSVLPLALAAAKEKTITGEGQCGKCALHEADACQNVIVTEGKKGKKEVYWLEQNEVSKAFHDNFCKEAKKITATGTVKKEGGKMLMTASKIEVVK